MLAKPMARRLLVVLLLFNAGVAWAKKADKPAPPVDPTLVVGDSYTIRAERHGARQQCVGRLVKLNDRWIVLQHVAEARPERRVPLLSTIPLVGRSFRSPAVARADEYLWIPREAASVEAHTPAQDDPSPLPAMGEEPVLQVSCAVELAQDKRVVRREGGLEAMTDEGLTLAVPHKVSVDAPKSAFGLPFGSDGFGKKKTETRYTRQQLSRHEILCVRVANFDPAALTARAH